MISAMEENIYSVNAAINNSYGRNARWHRDLVDPENLDPQVRAKWEAWQRSPLFLDEPPKWDVLAYRKWQQQKTRFERGYEGGPLVQMDQWARDADTKKSRTIAEMPPPYTDPSIKKDIARGKGTTLQSTKYQDQQILEDNPDIKESGRHHVQRTTQVEHAIHVGIDRNEVPKIRNKKVNGKWEKAGFSPLEQIGLDSDGFWRATETRGGDSRKTLFPGSGAYNVRIGTDDSFSIRQIRELRRPTNWQETIWDQVAFGNEVEIDITEQDWLRLQQKQITDGELLAHKFNVLEEGKRGNIFIDAVDPDTKVTAIHRKDRNYTSPKTHFEREVIKTPGGLKSRTFHARLREDVENFRKIKVNPIKGVKRIRRADIVAQLGMNASTGNIAGAMVNASFLSLDLVGKDPRTQKLIADTAVRIAQQSKPVRDQIRRELLKAVGKRGVKSAGKLIPGVDVYLSAREAWSYFREGKFDQAAIASLSGAVGWVPGVGDFAACLLDASNTVIDVTRMKFGDDYDVVDNKKKNKQKPEIVGTPTADNRELNAIRSDFELDRKTNKSISRSFSEALEAFSKSR
tara:strand:- start:152 stop:1867 length:1716 start_codon:yes stop_codon:yes gene_type:complete